MIQIGICDDTVKDIANLSILIEKLFKEKNLNYTIIDFKNGNMLLKYEYLKQLDVIFLDIDMPDINGMELASKIRELNYCTEVIFVTNHDELVFKAYRYNALGFVRKKYLEEELRYSIDTLLTHIKVNKQYIIVSDNGINKKIFINDIWYIASFDHYVELKLENDKILVRKSLKEFEEELGNVGFIRIHSRYLINYKYLYSIERTVVVMTDKKQLPVSRSRIEKVKEQLQFFSRRL